jgi:cell division septum initiation protein DivIVA
MLAHMSAALHHLHSHGVVHLDVKPDNIFLGPAPHVHLKLGDLGLATVYATGANRRGPAFGLHDDGIARRRVDDDLLEIQDLCPNKPSSDARTAPFADGDTLPTPLALNDTSDGGFDAFEHDDSEGDSRYMAPELLRSGGRAPPADIFSLGLSLFEFAWGCEPPLEGEGWHEIRQMKIPPLSQQLTEHRSLELLSCIVAMLHHVPEKRPTAADILEMPVIQSALANPDPFLAFAADRAYANPQRSPELSAMAGGAMFAAPSFALTDAAMPDAVSKTSAMGRSQSCGGKEMFNRVNGFSTSDAEGDPLRGLSALAFSRTVSGLGMDRNTRPESARFVDNSVLQRFLQEEARSHARASLVTGIKEEETEDITDEESGVESDVDVVNDLSLLQQPGTAAPAAPFRPRAKRSAIASATEEAERQALRFLGMDETKEDVMFREARHDLAGDNEYGTRAAHATRSRLRASTDSSYESFLMEAAPASDESGVGRTGALKLATALSFTARASWRMPAEGPAPTTLFSSMNTVPSNVESSGADMNHDSQESSAASSVSSDLGGIQRSCGPTRVHMPEATLRFPPPAFDAMATLSSVANLQNREATSSCPFVEQSNPLSHSQHSQRSQPSAMDDMTTLRRALHMSPTPPVARRVRTKPSVSGSRSGLSSPMLLNVSRDRDPMDRRELGAYTPSIGLRNSDMHASPPHSALVASTGPFNASSLRGGRLDSSATPARPLGDAFGAASEYGYSYHEDEDDDDDEGCASPRAKRMNLNPSPSSSRASNRQSIFARSYGAGGFADSQGSQASENEEHVSHSDPSRDLARSSLSASAVGRNPVAMNLFPVLSIATPQMAGGVSEYQDQQQNSEANDQLEHALMYPPVITPTEQRVKIDSNHWYK